MNNEKWLSRNNKKLANKWERMFVGQVLLRVDDLDWASLEAQLPFRDRDGRQRYADFAISEGEHVRIVLEVDGYDKTGRGTGMTKAEFVDWQRRQNALADQGWAVLRFVNGDVRDHPARCAEHITLLLRQQRHAMKHHENLHRSILAKGAELEETKSLVRETARKYGAQLEREQEKARTLQEKQKRLEKDLQTARREMSLAEKAPPLDETEARRLTELNQQQQEELEKLRKAIKGHEKENSIMKTAIWAFTMILIVALILLVYVLVDQESLDQAPSATQPEPRIPIGKSCENPANWVSAGQHIGQRVALAGPVAGISYRRQSQGQPTWINIGADFPDSKRLVLIIWGRNRPSFTDFLSRLRTGDIVCATGEVSQYQGIPQIELASQGQIRLQ
mgnify:FL=1